MASRVPTTTKLGLATSTHAPSTAKSKFGPISVSAARIAVKDTKREAVVSTLIRAVVANLARTWTRSKRATPNAVAMIALPLNGDRGQIALNPVNTPKRMTETLTMGLPKTRIARPRKVAGRVVPVQLCRLLFAIVLHPTVNNVVIRRNRGDATKFIANLIARFRHSANGGVAPSPVVQEHSTALAQ